MGLVKEFKEFAVKGSMVDMAVGIIIGAAFGKVVSSLVDDVIMPPIGLLLGRVDFSNLFVSLNGHHYASVTAAKQAGAATINYGMFVNTIISFVIVALAVFLLIKGINRLRRQQETKAEVTEKTCPYCASAIPLAATRCPHCTSELAAGEAPAG